MIAKVLYGTRTLGLLRYLYGPGRYQEHVDPRLVASWDGMEPDPGRRPAHEQGTALHNLAQHLDRPVRAYDGKVERHVWHTSVRCAPSDPILDDEQWGGIARRLVAAAGIAPVDDEQGCRWIAVRHADDHIHIVATLVRQDMRRPNLRGDFYRLREECRAIEGDYGLRITASADRTAASRPTQGERAKSRRVWNTEQTPREKLAAAVRKAAVAATGEADFFRRLEKDGLHVEPRELPSGDAIGYKVALPGDHTKDGGPVWYSGSRLAPDLSLPRVRQRWAGHDLLRHPVNDARAVTAVWLQAADAVRQATAVLGDADDPRAAAATAALSDLLTGVAGRAPREVRRELEVAAREFERVGRVPWRMHNEASRRTRSAAHAIVSAGRAVGSGDEGAAVLALIVAVIEATRAVAARQRAQQTHAHAMAARLASAHLQTAAELLGARPRVRANHQAASRAELRDALRRAVGNHTTPEVILADAAWPALADLLQRVESMGHDPAAALKEVTEQRALRTDKSSPSRSDAQVLTWRLQHWLADHHALSPESTRPDTPDRSAPASRSTARRPVVTPRPTRGRTRR